MFLFLNASEIKTLSAAHMVHMQKVPSPGMLEEFLHFEIMRVEGTFC